MTHPVLLYWSPKGGTGTSAMLRRIALERALPGAAARQRTRGGSGSGTGLAAVSCSQPVGQIHEGGYKLGA